MKFKDIFDGIRVSRMSLQLAWTLGPQSRMELDDFLKKSYIGEYLAWTHCNVAVQHMSWGIVSHSIATRCRHCDSYAHRNVVGIGTMCLLNTGDDKLVILCHDCASGYTQYHPGYKRKAIQLSLF
jgi:hypothetical protein